MKAVLVLTLVAMVTVTSCSPVAFNLDLTVISNAMWQWIGVDSVDVDWIDLRQYGHLSKLNVANLKSLTVESLTVNTGPNPEHLIIAFKGHLESVSATSEFVLHGLVVNEIDLRVDGTGSASAEVTRPFASGNLVIQITDGLIKLVDIYNVEILMDSIEADMTGIADHDRNVAIINTDLVGYLNNELIRRVEEFKKAIIDWFNGLISSNHGNGKRIQ